MNGRARAKAGTKGKATEAEAREARFGFFEREMGRRRIRALWLGHQQDDIAETMLMRLSRGSGAGGLAAPRPVHEIKGGATRLRPLLTLKKKEIEGALRRAGAAWREDATNAGMAHFRNRVRRKVVSRWIDASGRDATAGAALSRELLEEDDRALEHWLDALRPIGPDGALELKRIAGLPRAVARRALHRWLVVQDREGILSRQGFEALLAAVERGIPARHSLGAEGFAIIRRGRLYFISLH